MALIRIDDDGTIYLTASVDSANAEAIYRDPRVSVSVQQRKGFAMLVGEARVSRDRMLIDELWEDTWSIWYPDGKNDPDIAILVVSPIEATYWPKMGHRLSHLFRVARARLTGEDVEHIERVTATIDLRARR
jgi:general stress protein 26